MKHEQHILADLIGKRTVVPKGTADAVMERLFPTRRSEVPLDDDRKIEVYTILLEVGAFDLKEYSEQDLESADGLGEGTSSPEGEEPQVSDKHEKQAA